MVDTVGNQTRTSWVRTKYAINYITVPLKLVGVGGIEPPTHASYLIYSQATTISPHAGLRGSSPRYSHLLLETD